MHAAEVRIARPVVDREPRVVVEVGLVVGRGRLDRVRPRRAVVVAARDRRLLAADLVAERIGEARVVDDCAAREPEASVAAAARAVIEAGVAAREAPDAVEARQVAARPRRAAVRRAVERRDRPAGRERAWRIRVRARVERELVVRTGDQHACQRIARDRRLVLLVLRERQPVVEVDEHIPAHARACSGGRTREDERCNERDEQVLHVVSLLLVERGGDGRPAPWDR